VDYDSSLYYLNKAKDINPKSVYTESNIYAVMGDNLYMKKLYSEAIANYEKALEIAVKKQFRLSDCECQPGYCKCKAGTQTIFISSYLFFGRPGIFQQTGASISIKEKHIGDSRYLL
jgi:tetratricopeptide (TPR) repeat protein